MDKVPVSSKQIQSNYRNTNEVSPNLPSKHCDWNLDFQVPCRKIIHHNLSGRRYRKM